ncbi:MAG: trehalose-phosphatase [Chloroflexota bacterium]|nr:trehalose-phosphatase [Chloroflexota bacterium]
MAESRRSTDASLSRALELARDALAEAPAGLLTDFDGTVSPLVGDPPDARLAPGAAEALETLVDRLAVVAVITGRAPLDVRRMADVPGLLIAGNHGIEWLEPDADAPSPSPGAAAIRARLTELLERVPPLPGLFIEEKGLSATVHYRAAAEPDAARAAIVAAFGDPGDRLAIRYGHLSVELRPVGLGDKGAAARAIVERFALRGAVVMGDDLTDLDMFAAVADLRATGNVRGAIIGVGGPDRRLPADVIAASDVVLRHPEEAAELLAELARGAG